MAGVNIGNVGLLYIKYQNDITETLNQEALSYKDPRQELWRGLQIEGRIHNARSAALGNTEDGAAFPAAERQKYTPYKVSRRFFHAIIQLTGGVMAAAKKSPQVARDAVESEVRGMLKGAMKYMNGMYFRDGTGVVSTVNGTGGISGGKAIDVEVDQALMLWECGSFDVYDATLTTKRGTVTVEHTEQLLNASGNSLVNFDALLPAGTIAGDKLVWRDSVNKTISGLDALIDDSPVTFQAVDVGDVPRYSSLVLDNGGSDQQLDPQLLRQFLSGLYQKTGKKPGALTLYASPWQIQEFEEMYEGELRFSPSDKTTGQEVTGFQSALGRIRYKAETDCPRDKLFAADLTQIYKATQKPLGWRLQGGQMFLRSDSANVWTATMDEVCQLYIKDRRTSGKLTNLDEQANIAY